MKTWTEEETGILIEHYQNSTNLQLAQLLPAKSHLAIYKKAYKMGFRKTPEIEFRNRSNARKREKASSWKGGIKNTNKGYRQLLMPEHKRADSCGYVMEHIVVFENATGIEIPDGCCIHHLNGVKNDNRIENLCLMTHAGHTVFHHSGKTLSDETKKKISEKRRKYEP